MHYFCSVLASNESGSLETTTISILHSQPMYASSMLITWSSSSLYIKSSSTLLSLNLTSTVSILTQTSFASLISQSKSTSTANTGSTTQLHTFAVSSIAFYSLHSKSLISTEDIKPLSSELLTAHTQTDSFQALHTSPASTIAAGLTSTSLSLSAMPTLTQTEYTQFSVTFLTSTISHVGLTSPLSLAVTPTLSQTVSPRILFNSPSSTSAAGWKQDHQPLATGVSVTVVILCIAAIVVAIMMITFAVYMYR